MAVLSYFANPARFMRISSPLAWGFTGLGAALILWGVYLGLYVAPSDFRQGDAARIMFVHVPSGHVLADVAAKSAAPIGAAFTALCLMTGSIWGKPIWGTWWEWDARMTSVLILFFLYLGYIALWNAMETPQKASRAAAILCLVGVVNLPIITFSVEWWNTLHQTKTFFTGDEQNAYGFKTPMYIVALGYLSLFGGLTLLNMRAEVFQRRTEALVQRKLATSE
jgi:heme exporter protein C